ncbi:MAG: thioredoxin domain-containing protein [Bacteroidota bacterium]
MLKNKQATDLKLPVKTDEPKLGDSGAKIQIVMYGDYEDPKCRKAFKEVEELLEKYSGKFQFIWRHFPLNKTFQKSQKAAEMAIAAMEQNKFWEMHRMLINEKNKLNLTDLVAYAKEIEIYNKNLYNALINNKYSWDVRESMTGGVESGIKKLPAIFINGKLMDTDINYKTIEAEILR